MRKAAITVVLLICFLNVTLAFLKDNDDWVVVFEDDFNGKKIDEKKWTPKDHWPHTDVEL